MQITHNKFSLLSFCERLREYREDATDNEFLTVRFIREPGADGFTVVMSESNPMMEVNVAAQESIHYIPEVCSDLASSILSTFKEAFDIAEPDDNDENVLGDIQAEELFTFVLTSGFNLLESSPYYELLLETSLVDSGFVVDVLLLRNNYNQETQEETKSILFRAVYPLISIEQEENEYVKTLDFLEDTAN